MTVFRSSSSVGSVSSSSLAGIITLNFVIDPSRSSTRPLRQNLFDRFVIGEQLTAGLNPVNQPLDALLHTHSRRPSEVLLGTRDFADKHRLIARTPVLERAIQIAPEVPVQHGNQFQQR